MSPEAIETRLTVPLDHPAFDGHFPGRPVLPGVALLAEALAAAGASSGTPGHQWSVQSVKFLSPVSPGTQLVLSHRLQDARTARFEIRCGARLVASGVLGRPGGPS